MEDYNWEYINDSVASANNYDELMTEETYLDDIYYEDEKNAWEKYYYEIYEEIKY